MLDTKPCIEEVQQQTLVIGDNRNPADGIRFLRSLATAVETGRLTGDSSDDPAWAMQGLVALAKVVAVGALA